MLVLNVCKFCPQQTIKQVVIFELVRNIYIMFLIITNVLNGKLFT